MGLSVSHRPRRMGASFLSMLRLPGPPSLPRDDGTEAMRGCEITDKGVFVSPQASKGYPPQKLSPGQIKPRRGWVGGS